MTTRRDDDLDQVLDRALEDIRGERPDPGFEQAATDRVWLSLGHEATQGREEASRDHAIRSCAGFQAMLPDYLAGRLTRARLLLLEDHLGECVPCRRALKDLRSAPQSLGRTRRAPARGWVSTVGWRMAAAAVIFVALVGFSWKTDVFSFESGGLIRIQSVEGDLFHVTDDTAVPLKVGDVLTLEQRDAIRTAKGSTAILAMADDSQIEMRERSQLAVRQRNHLFPGRRSDGMLDLERGSIIVEASDQGSGHLYVDTHDCNVAVTGTVFSVSHGTKGSRVSVVEGEVHVNHRGGENVLVAGDQTTTHQALDSVPVEQDIAWSRNVAEYLELLGEVRALGREIDEVLQPDLRYQSDILEIAPAGTVVYFAMPNISDELGRAYEILQDRVATSVVLKRWWEQNVRRPGDDSEIEQIIEKIRVFGDYLDDEIVMTLQLGLDGDVAGPLFLARPTDPQAFMQTLAEEVAKLEAQYDEELEMRLIEGRLPLIPPDANDTELYVWTQGDILAMTPNYDNLWALEAALQGHEGATLDSGGAFQERVRELYSDGVQWAIGVDLQRLVRTDPTSEQRLEPLGLLDVEHLIGERKQTDGMTDNRVVLTFDQPRRSVASWLAEPAPMGALNYISPDANLVGAFVMKDMGVVVDELFKLLGATEDENFERALAEFEGEQGIDVRRDIAGPFGGEFAVAIDGPVLPTPSWKLILEVYDPTRLQGTLEWLVNTVNEATSHLDGASLTFDSETIGSREYFRLASSSGFAVHFVFDDGYLIAGPSRGLLDRALQNCAAGIKLIDSAQFLELLPRDEQVNFSGMLYQNVAPLIDPVSRTLETFGGATAEQQKLIRAMAQEAKPSLALLYGGRDRITLASSSEGGLFSSMLNQISGATGLLSMQQSLGQALMEHGAGVR